MNTILRLLFRFHTEYRGDPRFIMGNALRHALSLQLDTSIGIFTDSQKLSQPKTYQDFFSIRTKKHFSPIYFELFFDKIQKKRKFRCFFTPSFVTFDCVAPPSDLIEKIQSLELLQLGGARNCGFGAVTLHDSVFIDVDELQFIEEASHLTLVSPMVHMPSIIEKYKWRYEDFILWNNNKSNPIHAVAPGQFFRLKMGLAVEKIAKEGILRRERAHRRLLGQFGFGEFILNNWKKEGN
jgi:hypothetical protein